MSEKSSPEFSRSSSVVSFYLYYECHAEKNLFQWKQKAYPIWKLEWTIAILYDVNINYKYIYMAYTNSLSTSKWKFKLENNFHTLQSFMLTSLDKHQVLVQQWHNGYQKLFKLSAHYGLTWVNFFGLVWLN